MYYTIGFKGQETVPDSLNDFLMYGCGVFYSYEQALKAVDQLKQMFPKVKGEYMITEHKR